MNVMQRERQEGAEAANAQDASVWRWFSELLEDRRIKWRYSFGKWVITVDRMQLSMGGSFDSAIRLAKTAMEAGKDGSAFEGHRRDQLGRKSADLQRGPLWPSRRSS
jgi:hypothetical protein